MGASIETDDAPLAAQKDLSGRQSEFEPNQDAG
jgi:hypothetical protein